MTKEAETHAPLVDKILEATIIEMERRRWMGLRIGFLSGCTRYTNYQLKEKHQLGFDYTDEDFCLAIKVGDMFINEEMD